MPIIRSLLDTDLYKLTMQQAVYHRFAEAEAEYALSNRTHAADFRPLMSALREEIDSYCALRFTPEELAYLRGIPYFHASYVDSLQGFALDPASVALDDAGGQLRVRVRGPWYQTILFEVPLLAMLNELWFRHTRPSGSGDAPEEEGMRRLLEKCRKLRESGAPIALFEFGTRRRYGRAWQRRVIETLRAELGDTLKGTSNVAFARELGLAPFGTMAHEYLQACQVFAPLPRFQRYALQTWMDEYRGDLGIALSDVVGMDAFLRDFDKLFSKAYDGCRHDSGDPVEWGNKLIAHYERLGIDPMTKTAVFSDALDTDRVIALAKTFQGRVKTAFGVGTHLTNDLGFSPLSVVVKMVRCNGQPVAKLSDSPGKTICEDPIFLAYIRHVFEG